MVGQDKIYSSCDGICVRIGYDKSYGNFVVIKSNGKYHWFCHLRKIYAIVGKKVARTTVIGLMGSTGNSTGKHLHYEIRNASNKYADVSNPAEFMGIPNKVDSYNSANYKVVDSVNNSVNETKVLAKNTNLRTEPSTSAKASLYLANTTVIVLAKNVASHDGYVWDKVKVRANGKVGYMINKNYK